MAFGTPDLIIFSVIVLSGFIGVARGLIKESITLISWTIAALLALNFTEPFSSYVTFVHNPSLRKICAFVIIAVGTLFIGAIVNVVVGSLVRKTPFNMLDRALGAMFGLLRGIAFVSVVILLGGLIPNMTEEQWWKQSYSIGRFQVLSLWLKDRLPDDIASAFYFSDEPGTEKMMNAEEAKKYKQIKKEIQS